MTLRLSTTIPMAYVQTTCHTSARIYAFFTSDFEGDLRKQKERLRDWNRSLKVVVR